MCETRDVARLLWHACQRSSWRIPLADRRCEPLFDAKFTFRGVRQGNDAIAGLNEMERLVGAVVVGQLLQYGDKVASPSSNADGELAAARMILFSVWKMVLWSSRHGPAFHLTLKKNEG